MSSNNPVVRPDFFSTMHPLLVTAAIILQEDRVLVTQRPVDVPYPGFWEFPGGKVESGEDPRDCVVREVREELGIGVREEGIYDVVMHRYPERTVLILAYRCRWISGDIANLGVAAHLWLSPENLGKLSLLPADIPLAKRLATEFGNADSTGR